jgi:hypothetical protein
VKPEGQGPPQQHEFIFLFFNPSPARIRKSPEARHNSSCLSAPVRLTPAIEVEYL